MSELRLLTETPWETRNLGVASYALRDESIDLLDIRTLAADIERLRQRHTHYFVFARLPKSHLQCVPALQNNDFYLVECTFAPYIQFEKNRLMTLFSDNDSSFIPKRFEVADIAFETVTTVVETEPLYEIARESFSDDRFHMDFRCPKEIADRRFENWVQDLIHSQGVHFDLLKVRGSLAGFMARKEHQLILAGFSKKYQRSGLGDYLWLSSCKAIQNLGHQHAETLISANNLPVLNLYGRLGFKFRDTRYSFHAWN